MKYLTTKENPVFKEGLKIKFTGNKFYIEIELSSHYWMSENQIHSHLQRGYIKEIEGKEFTKSDMIAFQLWNNIMTKNGVTNDLKIWLNQKNK